MSDPSGTTTLVVGARRGLGRGIAQAFADTGAPVVAVARCAPALADLAAAHANIRTEIADRRDRGEPGDATAAAPDMGDALRQLPHRRQDRVHVATRGTPEALAAGKPGGGGEQRRDAQAT